MICAICGNTITGISDAHKKEHQSDCPIFVDDIDLVNIINDITGFDGKTPSVSEKPMPGTKRVWEY
jgi:hypothetical protein